MRALPNPPPLCAALALAVTLIVLPSSLASGAPMLVSFDATLTDPFAPPPVDDLGILVTGGVEINRANSTNIGDLFFDDEFVDVASDASTTFLRYLIQGGLNAHPVNAGYSTSWPTGTTLLFSNFVLDQPGTLVSVGVSVDQAQGMDRVIGAGGGALVNGVDYVFTTSSLLINIGTLGILEQQGQTPLGLMTFRLGFQADQQQQPEPVPEPASLMLIGTGIAALAARRRSAHRRL